MKPLLFILLFAGNLFAECEQMPTDLTYLGLVRHFGRMPDHSVTYDGRSNLRVAHYTNYYWGYCDGSVSLALIIEEPYSLDEWGILEKGNGMVYLALMQLSIQEVKTQTRKIGD